MTPELDSMSASGAFGSSYQQQQFVPQTYTICAAVTISALYASIGILWECSE